MKRIKMITLIFLIAILSIGFAYAQTDPVFTNQSTMAFHFAEGDCASDGESLYCFSGSGVGLKDNVIIYNLTSFNLTNREDEIPFDVDSFVECKFFTDSVYCFVQNISDNTQDNSFRYNISSRVTTRLTSPSGTDLGNYGCSLLPESDRVYCWGSAVFPNNNTFIKFYDISEDNWTHLKRETWESIAGCEAGVVQQPVCEFRNTQELYCTMGDCTTAGGVPNNKEILIYDLPSNQSTFVIGGYGAIGNDCMFTNDVLYCWGGEGGVSGNPLNNISFYIPTTNTTGQLNVTLPFEYVAYASYGEVLPDTGMLFGGWRDPAFNENLNVFTLNWTLAVTPVTPETVVPSTAATIVSLFVIVFSAFAIIIILSLGLTGKMPVLQAIILSIFVVIGALLINEVVQTVITAT